MRKQDPKKPLFSSISSAAAAIPASQEITLSGGNKDAIGNLAATLADPAQLNLVAIGIVGACLGLLYTQLNPIFHKSEAAPAAARPADDLDNELE